LVLEAVSSDSLQGNIFPLIACRSALRLNQSPVQLVLEAVSSGSLQGNIFPLVIACRSALRLNQSPVQLVLEAVSSGSQQGNIFPLPQSVQIGSELTQSPVQLVLEAVSPQAKRQGREAGRSPSLVSGLRMLVLCLHSPIRLCDVVLIKCKDNVIFLLASLSLWSPEFLFSEFVVCFVYIVLELKVFSAVRVKIVDSEIIYFVFKEEIQFVAFGQKLEIKHLIPHHP
jgi:hypothetical protein